MGLCPPGPVQPVSPEYLHVCNNVVRSAECGRAAAGVILLHHGLWFTLFEVLVVRLSSPSPLVDLL